jgi:hypothetical protein
VKFEDRRQSVGANDNSGAGPVLIVTACWIT